MKTKLGRTARAWVLGLLLLNGVLLALIVWAAMGSSGLKSNSFQPSEPSKSVTEESRAVETVQPQASRKGPLLPERARPRPEVQVAPTQTGPTRIAPTTAAAPTQDDAVQVRDGILKGMRSLATSGSRPADAGRAGAN
jgi:hypothetical protein